MNLTPIIYMPDTHEAVEDTWPPFAAPDVAQYRPAVIPYAKILSLIGPLLEENWSNEQLDECLKTRVLKVDITLVTKLLLRFSKMKGEIALTGSTWLRSTRHRHGHAYHINHVVVEQVIKIKLILRCR